VRAGAPVAGRGSGDSDARTLADRLVSSHGGVVVAMASRLKGAHDLRSLANGLEIGGILLGVDRSQETGRRRRDRHLSDGEDGSNDGSLGEHHLDWC